MSMGRMAVIPLAASLLICCGQAAPTGIDLLVTHSGAVTVQALEIRGYIAGEPAFEPGVLPDPPRDLAPAGENVIILVSPRLSGEVIDIRVDGLAHGQVA